jgi:hypothetical protein
MNFYSLDNIIKEMPRNEKGSNSNGLWHPQRKFSNVAMS